MDTLNLRKNASVYLRQYKELVFLLYVSGFLLVSLELVLPMFSKLLFDLVYREKQLSALNTVIFALISFYCIQFSTRTFFDLLSLHVHQRLSLSVRTRLFDHLQSLVLRFFKQQSKGDLVVRLTDDIERSLTFILTQTMDLSFAATQLVGICALCIWINQDSAPVLALSIPFFLVASRYLFKKELGVVRDLSIEQKSKIIEFFQTRFQSISLIKTYRAQPDENRQLDQLLREQCSLGIQDRILKAIFSLNSGLSFDLWTVFVTWYFGADLIENKMTIGDFIALVLLFGQIRNPLTSLTQLFGRFRTGMAAIRRVEQAFKWPLEGGSGSVQPVEKVQSELGISISDLHFSYSPTKSIFRGLNLSIAPKTYVVIAGDNGAGKSTLAKLLAGLEDPDSGSIALGDLDVKACDKKLLSQAVISVTREQFVCFGTIRQSIAYGNSKATEGQIIQAAKDAMIWDWIDHLPNKLDTMITSDTDLSHSERQRLAIARAILMDPKILVLDDIIGDLDPMSDYLTQMSIRKMLEKRTVVSLANNASSLRNADRIVFLSKGEVRDDGKFETLMKSRGPFFQFHSVATSVFAEFKRVLDYEIERSFRHESTFSVASFNIKNYEQSISKLNTESLAKLNSEIFLLWLNSIRRSDIVAEFSLGTFLVLLPELKQSDAPKYLERMEKQMSEKSIEIKGESFKFQFRGYIETYDNKSSVSLSSEKVIEAAVKGGVRSESADLVGKVA